MSYGHGIAFTYILILTKYNIPNFNKMITNLNVRVDTCSINQVDNKKKGNIHIAAFTAFSHDLPFKKIVYHM